MFGAALAVLGCAEAASPQNRGEPSAELRLQQVAAGLASPVFLTAPTEDERLFVIEQAGRVRIIEGGSLLEAPFLDIVSRVRSGGERGLLGLAFHPRYASNGFFYLNYTDRNGDTRVERHTVSNDRNRADPASALLILAVAQPFGNHNGGMIAFGPDGMLYIGMGDGGSGGDPQGNGQNRGTLLGALLRIDVDGDTPYAIPADNPFVGQAGVRPEIWAYGLRNPWRFAFDRGADLLYIADVGQNAFEEVNAVDSRTPGLNYGWKIMEGAHCFGSSNCSQSGLVLPVVEYGHGDGCSVTGGFAYRGSALPALHGHYFYADYCSGWVRSFRLEGDRVADETQWSFGNIGSIPSFGEDSAGELYVLTGQGTVYRIVPDT